MKTAFSNVVSGFYFLPAQGEAFGASAGTANAAQIAFSLNPLFGGFCARLKPTQAAWNSGFGVARVAVQFAERGAPHSFQLIEVYEPEAGDNMTLQRTILNLTPGATYDARFLLFNAENIVVYASASHSVST